MLQQACLPGFEAAPRPTDNLFFAVLPDAAAAARIAALTRQLRAVRGLKGKPIAAERLHVTLHHLGNHHGLPQAEVARGSNAAAGIELPPFDVVFDRVGSFGKGPNRPLVLQGGEGVAALKAFQHTLSTALMKAGFVQGARAGLTPHVTLLYDDRSVAELAIEPIAWTVHEFVLVDSLIGQSVHRPLARWPLRG